MQCQYWQMHTRVFPRSVAYATIEYSSMVSLECDDCVVADDEDDVVVGATEMFCSVPFGPHSTDAAITKVSLGVIVAVASEVASHD